MVTLREAQSSNARISKDLPEDMVSVFVGGTSGIGEYALRAFVKYARNPKVYLVGRSKEAADTIISDCKEINAGASVVFFSSDVAELKNVDDVCQSIKTREATINLLFLTQGTLVQGKRTSEGLPVFAALPIHSRARFIANLLPLLQAAEDLRRVVSVMAGTYEASVIADAMSSESLPFSKARGHAATVLTLYMEAFARKAPNVSFVHTFPGFVKTGIGRGLKGSMTGVIGVVMKLFGPLIYIPQETSGEMHLFAATSARYAPSDDTKAAAGIPMQKSLEVSRGIDGKQGSGVYSIDQTDEPASSKVEALLANLRKDGTDIEVWNSIQEDFKRITGTEAI